MQDSEKKPGKNRLEYGDRITVAGQSISCCDNYSYLLSKVAVCVARMDDWRGTVCCVGKASFAATPEPMITRSWPQSRGTDLLLLTATTKLQQHGLEELCFETMSMLWEVRGDHRRAC